MKTFPFTLLAAACSFAAFLVSPAPGFAGNGTLVIERVQNTGFLDLIPMTVLVDKVEVTRVESGAKSSVTVPAGPVTLSVRSKNPDSAKSPQAPPVWESGNMALTLGSGATVRVIVRPGMAGQEYSGKWELEKAE